MKISRPVIQKKKKKREKVMNALRNKKHYWPLYASVQT